MCCRHLELGTVPVQGKHEAEAGVGNRVIPVQGMGCLGIWSGPALGVAPKPHLLQKIFRDFQDAMALGPAPCHAPHLAPLLAHWGCLVPAQLSIPRGTCACWAHSRPGAMFGVHRGDPESSVCLQGRQSQPDDPTAQEGISCGLGFSQRANRGWLAKACGSRRHCACTYATCGV